MIQTFPLQPGITLRCFPDNRFKQGLLSIQFLRPMGKDEAALNAIIPTILLRGTQSAPDLRAITLRLDDLYGAAVGCVVRRVGDYQTTGLQMRFISDRYAMDGDKILEPAIDFLGQLLFDPLLENGVFPKSFVSGEKRNLIAAIEAQRNDKRAYAAGKLLKKLCAKDSYGIPRLGGVSQVRKITPKSAYEHYQKVLRESPVEIFYVGENDPRQVADLLQKLFSGLERSCAALPPQTPLNPAKPGDYTETMEVAQGKLAMGFVTPITIRDAEFAAMQVCNAIFGGGMTNLLFMNIREKLSLCYDIGSAYHGSKGLVTVSAGIDPDKFDLVKAQVLTQLEALSSENFTEEIFQAAKQGLLSSLSGIHDSPGGIENYYASGALSGQKMTPEQYADAVRSVTRQQVAACAKALRLHTTYFLKGVQ